MHDIATERRSDNSASLGNPNGLLSDSIGFIPRARRALALANSAFTTSVWRQVRLCRGWSKNLKGELCPTVLKSIREEIQYEYAKLITRSAYGSLERAFITDRFMKLRSGEITMSDTIREWEREQSCQGHVYLRRSGESEYDHLIPVDRGGKTVRTTGASCRSCNSAVVTKASLSGLVSKRKTIFIGSCRGST